MELKERKDSKSKSIAVSSHEFRPRHVQKASFPAFTSEWQTDPKDTDTNTFCLFLWTLSGCFLGHSCTSTAICVPVVKRSSRGSPVGKRGHQCGLRCFRWCDATRHMMLSACSSRTCLDMLGPGNGTEQRVGGGREVRLRHGGGHHACCVYAMTQAVVFFLTFFRREFLDYIR